MAEDIRKKRSIGHDDVIRLNFVRARCPYRFRRYYRNGLRSHVMAVLHTADVKKEAEGLLIDGLRWFPEARPVKMLRLFRRNFSHHQEILEEINRVKLVEQYLTPRYMAQSIEFVVDYRRPDTTDILLCGLQEFVSGEVLDPWFPWALSEIPEIIRSIVKETERDTGVKDSGMVQRVQRRAGCFVRRIKTMIAETGYIPDLAGNGNMLLTPSGTIKLVDINNISPVTFGREIYLDDMGYPVCDKSIEALSLMERHLLERLPDMTEAIYGHYLDRERARRVRRLVDP